MMLQALGIWACFRKTLWGCRWRSLTHVDLAVACIKRKVSPAAHLQVADHLDINRDDSDDSKVASLGAVVAPGEQIWCKVVEVKEGDERWVLCRAAVFLPGCAWA